MSPTHEIFNLVVELNKRFNGILANGNQHNVKMAKMVLVGVHGITCNALAMSTSYLAGNSHFRIEIIGNSYAKAGVSMADKELAEMVAVNITQLIKISMVAEKIRRNVKMRKLVAEIFGVLDDANKRLHALNGKSA